MPDKLPEVTLYTDGACSGNPGPGGWAYILVHPATGKAKRAAGAEPHTTNNRMELTAAIEGLAALKSPCRVKLVTDSEIVGKGLSEWMAGWKRRGWRKSDNKPVLNDDLWKRLDELAAPHKITVEWVRGHAGHPENEECDRMAVEAYRNLRAG
jgi:ribonuclease HI